MKIKSLSIAAIMLIICGILVSCHDDSAEFCEYGFKKGTVVFTGAPELDGCGWTIQIGEVAYHPVNLSLSYQINDLPVLIKFRTEADGFHCGRGGVAYQSIWITEIRYHGQDVRTLPEDQWDKYSIDPFHVDSAYVDGDYLMMNVSYTGGCMDHEFNLWKLPPNALNPPSIELALSHESNGDTCEAIIHHWLAFSLASLRVRSKHEITLLLRGSPEMSAYLGTFVYRY
jgi:hypothetical protein